MSEPFNIITTTTSAVMGHSTVQTVIVGFNNYRDAEDAFNKLEEHKGKIAKNGVSMTSTRLYCSR